MDFFKTNNYEIKDFLEDIHWTATRLLQKCIRDKELSEKIYALIADELNQETIKYQNTMKRHMSDNEIAMLLGIVVYNRLLRESEMGHETN